MAGSLLTTDRLRGNSVLFGPSSGDCRTESESKLTSNAFRILPVCECENCLGYGYGYGTLRATHTPANRFAAASGGGSVA